MRIFLSILAGGIASAILFFLRASRRATLIGALLSAGLALSLSFWLVRSAVILSVDSPVNGDAVGYRAIVKGRVSPSSSKVFVIVRPQMGNSWWVQTTPIVQNDGQWQTTIYVGTEALGVGESFEILAVARQRGNWMRGADLHLTEGQQLETVPNELAKSNLVVVKRSH